MSVKLREITDFNRIVPRVMWSWGDFIDNNVIISRKHFHTESSRQVELFCDSTAIALALSARLSEMRAGTMVLDRILLQWIFS